MPSAAEELNASLAVLWPVPWQHEMSSAALVEFVSHGLDQHGLFSSAERAAKRVPQISVFVAHCAPIAAPRRGLELAAEFLFAFFALNDGWDAMQALFDGARDASPGVAFVRAWLSRIRRDYGDRAQRFVAAFELYLASLVREKRYEAAPNHPTFEEYVDRQHGRYQWVATAPYLALWELALGLELTDAERPSANDLAALTVELTYLANDLGSLARDSSAKNFVTLLSARDALGPDISPAVEATCRIYAEKAARLVAARTSLDASSQLARYVELLCNVADGNLRATTLLGRTGAVGRYSPAARESLLRLPFVSAD